MENEKKDICILVQEIKNTYKENKTSEEAKKAVEKHLSTCSECRQYYETVSAQKRDNQEKAYLNLAKRLKKRRYIIAASVTAVCICACILASTLFPVLSVSGNSMDPTYHDGDNIISSKLAYLISSPKRGDIVIASAPDSNVIKRVAALPGETVDIKNGCLYIDSKPVEEKYLPADLGAGDIKYPVTLGDDEYFLMGDNPSASHDSRFSDFGFISEDRITLKVLSRTF